MLNSSCDIHNQQLFFVYEMKIPKKWQIPLRSHFCKNVHQFL